MCKSEFIPDIGHMVPARADQTDAGIAGPTAPSRGSGNTDYLGRKERELPPCLAPRTRQSSPWVNAFIV